MRAAVRTVLVPISTNVPRVHVGLGGRAQRLTSIATLAVATPGTVAAVIMPRVLWTIMTIVLLTLVEQEELVRTQV